MSARDRFARSFVLAPGDLYDTSLRAAATEGDVWRGGDAMDNWKEAYLYGGVGVSSKGLRKRKASGRGSPVMANGNMMKGVLGEGPTVEY